MIRVELIQGEAQGPDKSKPAEVKIFENDRLVATVEAKVTLELVKYDPPRGKRGRTKLVEKVELKYWSVQQ